MKVAVLMSTYNGEKYLEKQLDSILSQKGDYSIEIIIRDDGSTDNTKNILKKYCKQYNNIRWYAGVSKGPALSFIELLRKNKGYDFYAFSDQDDYWLPNKLSRAIEKLMNEKASLYFANAMLVDSDLNLLNINVYKQSPKLDFKTLTCAGGILGCTLVLNNDLAKCIQNSNYPKKIIMHDFYISEVCAAIGKKIIYDTEYVMYYRQHNNNVVGVSYGSILNKIISRVKSILNKPTVSISDQANDIYINYSQSINLENKEWLRLVRSYKSSLATRLKLAFTHETKFVNKNQAVKNRLSIMLGNR
ncbi:glycosyltransferase family 2 protein [Limosilactobacillus mucosae]|uniref:glycosyltransferase family 2 protein n=1 Tax=Limosilactobacillus mucosae TaxID=97478 RepID=UPI003992DE1B